jgi:hypothetical protein
VLIERRSGTGQWTKLPLQSVGTQFNDTTSRQGSVVSYRVRAVNKAGQSAYSNVVRVQ